MALLSPSRRLSKDRLPMTASYFAGQRISSHLTIPLDIKKHGCFFYCVLSRQGLPVEVRFS